MPDSLVKEISTIAASLGLGGLLTLVVGRLMGKKKEEIDIAFTESKIYRELIAELKADRDERIVKEETSKKQIESLEIKVDELTKQVQIFIELDKEQQKTIQEQKDLIVRWENNSIKLKKQIDILIKEIEHYEKKNNT